MEVGVRELRDGLSRHLAAVKDGQTITVTEHGKPIARLVPIAGLSKMEQLMAEGKITPAKQPKRPARKPFPLKDGMTVRDLIDEQRGPPYTDEENAAFEEKMRKA